MRTTKYYWKLFFIFLRTQATQETGTDRSGATSNHNKFEKTDVLPTISTFNTTHAKIEYGKSFRNTPDPDTINPYLIHEKSPIFETPISENLVKLPTICQLKALIDSLEDSRRQEHCSNFM